MKDLKQSTKQRFGGLDFDYPETALEVAIVTKESGVDRAAVVNGPSCHFVPSLSNRKRPTKSEAVMSSLQATLIKGLPNFQAISDKLSI
jgi:hypothetical protein